MFLKAQKNIGISAKKQGNQKKIHFAHECLAHELPNIKE